MGALQNSTNAALGAVGTTAAVANYLKEQDNKKEAEIQSAAHQLKTNKIAQEFDAKEAAHAIKARAEDEKPEKVSEEEIATLTENENDMDKLSEAVQAIRKGKLMDNRMAKLDSTNPKKPYYQDDKTGRFISKSKYLDKAYAAERELKDRILATEELKFNIEEATARLKALGVSDKKIEEMANGK